VGVNANCGDEVSQYTVCSRCKNNEEPSTLTGEIRHNSSIQCENYSSILNFLLYPLEITYAISCYHIILVGGEQNISNYELLKTNIKIY
jgi:hypothetical protein